MGILTQTVRAGSTASKLKPDDGFLGILLKPLDALDAIGNATRSAIAGEYENAILSLIPGGGSERISGVDALERRFGLDLGDNFFTNLGVEILLDPLTYVGGIGAATKAGQTVKRAASLRAKLQATGARFRSILAINKKAGKDLFSKDLSKVKTELLSLQKALKELPKPEGPLKKAFDVGIPFGPKFDVPVEFVSKPAEALKSLIPKRIKQEFTLLAKARTVALTDELANLAKKREAFKGKGSPTKLIARFDTVAQELAKQPKSLLQVDRTTKIREGVEKLKSSFRQIDKDPVLEFIKEDLRAADNVGRSEAFNLSEQLKREVNILTQAEGVTVASLMGRMFKGAEYRKLRTDKSTLKASKEYQTLRKQGKNQMDFIAKLDIVSREKMRKEILTRYGKALKTIKNKAEFERLSLAVAEKEGLGLSPEVVSLINTQFKLLDDIVDMEAALGVNIKAFSTDKERVAYVRRILTPKAKKWKKTNEAAHLKIINNMDATLQAARPRKLFPELAVADANIEIRKLHNIDFDFFDNNFIDSLVTRKSEHYRAMNRGFAAHTVVQHFGVPKLKNGVSNAEFFKRVNLDPSFAPKGFIPKQIFDDALRNDALLKDLEQGKYSGLVAWELSAMDAIAKPFRLALTAPFAAFHVRNFFSNNWLNMMAGMSPAGLAKYNVQAIRLQNTLRRMKNGVIKAGDKEFDESIGIIRELQEFGAINDTNYLLEMQGGFLETWLKDKGVIDLDKGLGGVAHKATRKLGDKLMGRVTKNGDLLPTLGDRKTLGFLPAGSATPLTGKAFGTFVENNARVSHFLWKKAGGSLPFEARSSMNRYLFDYGNLTQFEREVMRPHFLFYTWTRKNLPLQISSAIVNPKLGAFYAKATNIGDGEVPTYLRGGNVFANPLGEGFVGSVGAPIEELNIFNVQDVDPGFFDQAPRFIEKILSQMNPLVQFPVEIAFGRDLFTRRQLSSIDEPAEIFQFLKEKLPTSRLTGSFEKLVKEDFSMTDKLLTLLSGVRVFPVSKLRARQDKLERIALSSGKFERSGFLVFPKRKYKDDPEVKQLTRQLNIIKRAKRDKSKR